MALTAVSIQREQRQYRVPVLRKCLCATHRSSIAPTNCSGRDRIRHSKSCVYCVVDWIVSNALAPLRHFVCDESRINK